MIYTLSDIHPPKVSANKNDFYIRLEFLDEDGNWYKTDICPSYRNYHNWTSLLKRGRGTRITNVRLKGEKTIDADSKIIIV